MPIGRKTSTQPHKILGSVAPSGNVLKDESGKNTINLTELEQSLSCPLTPRLTQSV